MSSHDGIIELNREIARLESALAAEREKVAALDARRGGECDTCGGWVCPPLRCVGCMMKNRVCDSANPLPLAADVVKKLDAENATLRAERDTLADRVRGLEGDLLKVTCSDGYFRATAAALEVAADTPGVSVEHRRQFLASMIAELAHAYRKHGARPWSRHEFYAVMREEVDEVWDAIKTDQPITEVLKEAMQIAAVCLRYAETEDAYRGQHPLPLPTRAALTPPAPAKAAREGGAQT